MSVWLGLWCFRGSMNVWFYEFVIVFMVDDSRLVVIVGMKNWKVMRVLVNHEFWLFDNVKKYFFRVKVY